MTNKIYVFIIIVSIIGFYFMFNYVNNHSNDLDYKNINTSNNNYNKNNNNNQNNNNQNNISNDDNISKNNTFFKNLIKITYQPISNDINCISKAAKDKSFKDIESCGRLLKEDANNSIRMISSTNVSSISIEIKQQYIKSLEYYNIAGKNLETGAQNKDAQIMSIGADAIFRANKFMENISSYIS